jgi:phage-related protein
MSDIAYREQSFSPGRLVSLFELDLSPLGVAQTLYFTVGHGGSAPIQFRGNSYTPVDIEATGFEVSGRGPIPQPTVRVANVANAVTSLLDDYDDLVGARVRRIRTFSEFLDGGVEGRNAAWADTMPYLTDAALLAAWTDHTGTAERVYFSSGDSDSTGYSRFGANNGGDNATLIHNQSVRYNPADTYRISARVWREAGTAATVSVGVAGRDVNDARWVNTSGADLITSQHMVAASAVLPATGAWVTYTGFFRGKATTGGGVATSQSSPSALQRGVFYFRPMVILNGGGTGRTRLGHVEWNKVVPASVAYDDYAFPVEVYTIERKSAHTKTFVEWQLAAAIDQEGRMLPGRQVLRDTCLHRYRSFEGGTFNYSRASCPYTGAACFTATGTPTTAQFDVCGKKLSDCRLRFGQNANLPTRAFPGVSRLRVN